MRDSLAKRSAQCPPSARAFTLAALLIAGAFTALLAPNRAHACSCMAQSPQDAIAQSVAVFEGNVLEIQTSPMTETEPSRHTVRMSVVRAFKGVNREEVVVTTPGDSAACGYAFEQGKSYLVYAYAADPADPAAGLEVSLCSRTQPIAQAGEDLAVLGLGSTPVDPKGETPLPDAPDKSAGQPPREPPARGGCAGCSVGAERDAGLGSALLLALFVLLTYRGRSRSLP